MQESTSLYLTCVLGRSSVLPLAAASLCGEAAGDGAGGVRVARAGGPVWPAPLITESPVRPSTATAAVTCRRRSLPTAERHQTNTTAPIPRQIQPAADAGRAVAPRKICPDVTENKTDDQCGR